MNARWQSRLLTLVQLAVGGLLGWAVWVYAESLSGTREPWTTPTGNSWTYWAAAVTAGVVLSLGRPGQFFWGPVGFALGQAAYMATHGEKPAGIGWAVGSGALFGGLPALLGACAGSLVGRLRGRGRWVAVAVGLVVVGGVTVVLVRYGGPADDPEGSRVLDELESEVRTCEQAAARFVDPPAGADRLELALAVGASKRRLVELGQSLRAVNDRLSPRQRVRVEALRPRLQAIDRTLGSVTTGKRE